MKALIRDFYQQYVIIVTILTDVGIVKPLRFGKIQGIVDIAGNEYPLPTFEQVETLLIQQEAKLRQKMEQGFTQLLLTPFAFPLPLFIDLIAKRIQTKATLGTLLRTRTDPLEPDLPAQVNIASPLWIWERIRKVLDSNDLVYFPPRFQVDGHGGLSKDRVIADGRYCAQPGWSVGLTESLRVMPQPGSRKSLSGRIQLANGASPNEYLDQLRTPMYQWESGWVLEDFLTYFLIHLESTGQVSHDRQDANVLWLLGAYLPVLENLKNIVLVGYWSGKMGRKLYLSGHRTNNHFLFGGARTMVRLCSSG